MNTTLYGFVNSNNLLIEIASFIKDDFLTIERVKNEYSAEYFYEIDEKKFCPVVGSSIWQGEYFTPSRPYPSWMWNSISEEWQPPFPSPEITNDSNYHYAWNEQSLCWDQVQNI